jgi:hypothetical protein
VGGNSGPAGVGMTLERAYLRFAGFTFGVAEENFQPMAPYMYTNAQWGGYPNGIKQIAYTATFGGGFSATLAIEASGDININSLAANAPPAPSAVPTSVVNNTYANTFSDGYYLIGDVRVDQAWGWAQLQGAIANDSTSNIMCTAASVVATCNPSVYSPLWGPTNYGAYAIGMTFRYNIGKAGGGGFGPGGDALFGTVDYVHGALGLLLNFGGLNNDMGDPTNKRGGGGVIRADSNLVPTMASTGGSPLDYGVTDGWDVFALYTHYWAPDWRSNVAAGYAEINPPTVSCSDPGHGITPATPNGCLQNTGLNTQWGDGKIWQVAANLIWSPVTSFDIGIEAEYYHWSSQLQNPNANFVAAGSPGLSGDSWIGKIRLERLF